MAETTPAPSRTTVMAVAMISTFMAALDGSIVNVALPVVGRALHHDVAEMQWVVTGYLLSICSLLLVFGRLADVWGYGSLMAGGFVVFGLASLGCGLTNGLDILVAVRVLQGAGAAMMMASGPALVTTSFPGSERGRALGTLATATYLGLALGPSIGGWITAAWGWHGIFLVNVPVAAAGLVMTVRAFRPRRGTGHHRFDLVGALLFSGALVSLLLGLGESEHAGWADARVLGLVFAGLLLMPLFVWRQARAPEPLLPLGLFRSGAFSGGVAAAYLQYLVLFVANFLVPFYLQRTLGMSPQFAGLVLTAQPAVMFLTTRPAGRLSDRIGPRIPSTIGLLLVAGCALVLGRISGQASTASVVVLLAVLGLGVGLFTSPNNSAILGAAPRERQGIASGLLAAARNVGMVSGVACGANLLAAGQHRLEHAGASGDAAFLGGFHAALLVASAIAVVGALCCLFRPGVASPATRNAQAPVEA